MNIILCGLTAAGKTTHCKLISREFSQFGFNYISASSLVLSSKDKSNNQEVKPLDYWISDQALELNNWRRKNRRFDADIDFQCQQAIDTDENDWVVDVLSASWLSKKQSLKVWIESSIESRVLKAIVSYKGTSRYEFDEIRRRINLVDLFNREYFLDQYKFDFFADKSPFDFVLDISTFIQEPSAKSSFTSVAKAQSLLSAIIKWKLGIDKITLLDLYQKNRSVFYKVPDTLLANLNNINKNFDGDIVLGDKFSGDKVMGNKIVIENMNGAHNYVGTNHTYSDNSLSYVIANTLDDSLPYKANVLKEIKTIENEAHAQSPNSKKVESAIKNIAVMAPDILDVLLDTLSNPVKGFVTVIRKVAEKAKSTYTKK